MIERTLAGGLKELATWYPVISVTGPRQSGKSTLVRAAFSEHRYLNLEDPSVRARATADPSGFIANNPGLDHRRGSVRTGDVLGSPGGC